MWGCADASIWSHHDVTLCAQNLGLVPLFLAAVLFVSFFRLLELRTTKHRRLLIKADSDAFLEVEQAEPDTPSLWDVWCANLTHAICFILVVIYAILFVNDFSMSHEQMQGDGNILIGDACSLAGWFVILGLLYLENQQKRITSRSLRILMCVDFVIKVVRLRTEMRILDGEIGLVRDDGFVDTNIEDRWATWVRVVACILTFVVTFMLVWDAPARRFSAHTAAHTADQGNQISGEETAGLWEFISIGWLSPMLARGSRETLKHEHLYQLNVAESPEVNAAEAQKLWDWQVQNNPSGPSLWAVTRAMHWKLFCMSGVLRVFQLGLTFLSPILLNLMIKFASGDEERVNGYIYAILLVSGMVINAIVQSHSQLFMYKLALRARSALTTLVFKKALTMSQESRSKFSQGEIANFMAVDARRLSDSATVFHLIWIFPLMFIICLVLLYREIGWAAFTGLVVMLLLAFPNLMVLKFFMKYSKSVMGKRDTRVKLLTEMLQGIKIVKFFGWEHQTTNNIERVRDDEVKDIESTQYIFVWMGFLSGLIPALISISSFAVYLGPEGKTLDAATAFTAIAYFQILQGPIQSAPMVLGYMGELGISMNRLKDFLMCEDQEAVSTDVSSGIEVVKDQRRKGVAGVAARIKNGNFRWREGKAGKADEKLKKETMLADKEKEIRVLQAAGTDAAEVEALQENVAYLKDEIGKLQEAIDSCGEETLLPIPEGEPPTLADVNIDVAQGSLTLIVGEVGCGKTSLLNALLTEIPRESGSVEVYGKVAYCAQEPFICNATLQDNILFHAPFDASRYEATIKACSLKDDLEALAGGKGDQTEIGEKGLNLSGGQKARLALARAVYADADTYFLDDILAAVDPEVATQLMDRCVMGLLGNKTRLMVTHHPKWVQMADRVIVMAGGKIAHVGSFAELAARGVDLAALMGFTADDTEGPKDDSPVAALGRACSALSKAESLSPRSPGSRTPGSRRSTKEIAPEPDHGGDLVKDEDKEEGAVSLEVWLLYFKKLGALCSVVILVGMIGQSASGVVANWYLNKWAAKSDDDNVDVWGFFMTYSLILVSGSVILAFRGFVWVKNHVSAVSTLHNEALWAIARCPMSYFDTTKKGRITNRFSNDQQKIDMMLRMTINGMLMTVFAALGALVAICYTAPYVLIGILPLGYLYFLAMQYYRQSVRELQRLSSTGISPVYSSFEEALVGVATIRAFNRERELEQGCMVHLLKFLQPSYYQFVSNEWLNIRLIIIGAMITAIAAFVCVIEHDSESADGGTGAKLGFTLTYAISITQQLSGFVLTFTATESALVAVERLAQFASLPSEPELALPEDPDIEEWPSAGHIVFENASMRYRENLDPVLHDLSFEVLPGERVGVCGRTGAGKSSILTALFRIAPLHQGRILIDDVDISKIGIHTLRQQLSIIPQEPMLFQGTLRWNLDPLKRSTDQQLWDVLEESNLKEFVEGRDGQLETSLDINGENLSLGQRQLLCLARALLRNSKVLVLDEATASVDRNTDALVQDALRRLKGVTTFTIAHRIDTIIDSDKILVLGKGRVLEYDSPNELRNNTEKYPNSEFSQIVKEYHAAAADDEVE